MLLSAMLRFSIVLVVVGACLFILSLSGGFTIQGVAILLVEPALRALAGLSGLVMVGLAVFFEFRRQPVPHGHGPPAIDLVQLKRQLDQALQEISQLKLDVDKAEAATQAAEAAAQTATSEVKGLTLQLEAAKRKIDTLTSRAHNAIRAMAEHAHEVIHSGRDVLNVLGYKLEIEREKKQLIDKGQYKLILDQYLDSFVNNTLSIFDTIIGKQCSVSIQMLGTRTKVPEGKRNRIHLLKNDKRSLRSREDFIVRVKNNDGYNCSRHSAYSDLMKGGVRKTTYFVNNNCSDANSNYRDALEDWQKHYNAILVVPIQFNLDTAAARHASDSASVLNIEEAVKRDICRSVLGFITVDSLHGQFDKDVSVPALAAHADYLYHILSRFYRLMRVADRTNAELGQS